MQKRIANYACKLVALFLIVGSVAITGCKKEVKEAVFSDNFQPAHTEWRQIYLAGDTGGSYKISQGKLKISLNDEAYYGVYYPTLVEGNFYAEASFEQDENVGLALIHEKDGAPDPENYTMICVDTNDDGNVVVSVKDCQNGAVNVLDNTTQYSTESTPRRPHQQNDSYEHILTGEMYSVPFKKTNKKLRIFHDNLADFFHFYYAVKKNIRGKDAEGWMELVPSKNWGAADQKYFVALIGLSKGEAIFDDVRVVYKPEQDQDDTKTGFKATRREFNWSGYFGDAVVVTFGDEFAYRDEDIKFVFWSQTNYIPGWHLHNQLIFTYEFMETWGGGNPGCHEPMSDRLLRWSNVNILEDNDVRKVVHWHYVLCDPDYKVPDNDTGEQLPEADEIFTFYPDGSGTRRLVYTPKLDTEFRAPHELGELISIAGSKAHSQEFFSSPALTLLNLDGDLVDTQPGPKYNYGSEIDDWKQMVMAVHLKELPDVFCAWSTDPQTPETYSGYKIRHELAWQSVNGKGVHWPVNYRPYSGNSGSGGTWEAEVSHSCLLSWGVRDGIEWEDHFKIDERGRKFRDWVSLIGLNEPNDTEGLRNKTKSWLFPGNINMLEQSSRFVKTDYNQKALIFENSQGNQKCHFEVNPTMRNTVLVNPVLRINNWGPQTEVKISINGDKLSKSEYKTHILDDKDLLIWIEKELGDKSELKIDKG